MGAGASVDMEGMRDRVAKASAAELGLALSSLDANTRDKLEAALTPSADKASFQSLRDSLKKAPLDQRAKTVLERGFLRLVRGKWLVEQPDGWVAKRMQELPSDALVEPKLAAELYGKFGYNFFRVIAVSYGWLSKPHPDPHGFHMKTLQHCLRRLARRNDRGEIGVFMDFLSLPQCDALGNRTPEEKEIFTLGLLIINVLYGAQQTLVLQLRKMPPPTEGLNLIPYEERGWCIFESVVSCLMKATHKLWDLSNAPGERTVSKIIEKSIGNGTRSPPLHPDAMEDALRSESTKFTNKSDVGVVCSIYQDFFMEQCESCEKLELVNGSLGKGWGVAEAKKLAKSLPEFKNCKDLWLSGSAIIDVDECGDGGLQGKGHCFGDEGMKFLAPALAKMASLERLMLGFCEFGEDGLLALGEAGVLPKLAVLTLPESLKHSSAAKDVRVGELWWEKESACMRSLVTTYELDRGLYFYLNQSGPYGDEDPLDPADAGSASLGLGLDAIDGDADLFG